jgi:hypothetical protein
MIGGNPYTVLLHDVTVYTSYWRLIPHVWANFQVASKYYLSIVSIFLQHSGICMTP